MQQERVHTFQEHAGEPIPVDLIAGDSVMAGDNWVFIVLVLSLMLIAWVRTYHNRGLVTLVRTFLSNKPLELTMLEENLMMKKVSVYLNVLFVLVTSLFIVQLSYWYEWRFSFLADGLARYGQVVAIVSVVYLFKSGILRLTGLIFEMEKESREYVFNTFLLTKLLGLLLFPLTVCIAFMTLPVQDVLLKAGLALVAISVLYRWIRGYIVGQTTIRFSGIHLFLYLCTLEFLPLIVAIKIFVIYK